MAQNANAAGHAHPVADRGLRDRLFAELVLAFKKLVKMAADKLAAICRLFNFRMSTKRAIRKVVEYYSKDEHPGGDQQVPASLLEAFAVLGLEAFTQAKQAGETIKTRGLTNGVETAVQVIFHQHQVSATESGGDPHIPEVFIFSRRNLRENPYWRGTTLASR